MIGESAALLALPVKLHEPIVFMLDYAYRPYR